MEAKAKLLGHPIHQMLIVFPLGLFLTAIIFDIVHLLGGGLRWAEVSYWMIGTGVIGGLLSAPFGLIDWLGIPAGTRAKRIGALHGIGNVILVVLFAASWFVRRGNPTSPGGGAYVLSFAGIALGGITAWLGGEMVNRLGIGVYPGAHADSPSSLSGRPATGDVRERMA
jgi:uncharacterized membrane protein